jgi:uroporphyrinogen decarboxylase
VSLSSGARVDAAFRHQEPDRLPWCELLVDPFLVTKMLGWGPQNQTFSLEDQQYTVEEAKEVAGYLGLDNLTYILRAPVFAEKHEGQDGRLFYGEGLIKAREEMAMFHLPDPREDAFWEPVKRFVEGKGDYSTWLVTRMGIMPTMLSMGTTAFSLALFDDRALVEEMFDRYLEWTCIVAERAGQIGFDAFATTDDVAFGSTTFFSPRVFRELCMDRYRELQKHLTIPWVYHSDGNMMPFMKELVTLDVACFHPMEKGAMDARETKQKFGDRLCLMGNVDLNLLGMGAPAEVEEEVKGLIRDLAPGGGYIMASGNSLAGYLIPENVLAMRDALRKYGRYPIRVEQERG